MKTTPKRLLGLLLAVLLIMTQPLAVLADNSGIATQSTTATSGVTGGVKWELDAEGVLTLSVAENGNGETPIEYASGKQPWNAHINDIKKLIVEDGVKILGGRLVYGATNLTEVILPESLTWVGHDAFRKCSSLKKVEFKGNFTKPSDEPKSSFGFAMFYDATALEEVVLPSGNYSVLEIVTFYNCSQLKKVTIPANITSLKNRTNNGEKQTPFSKCTALEEITYGGTIAQWEKIVAADKTFNGILASDKITVTCSDGTYKYKAEGDGENDTKVITGTAGNVDWTLDKDGKLTLTAKKNSDGSTGDFKDAAASPLSAHFANIKSIVIEDGVKYIGDYLFRGCAVETINFGKTLTGIGNSCFRDCTSLKSVVLPASLETLSTYVFMDCTALESATVNGSVSTLKDRVFKGCTALKDLTLSGSITSITYNGEKNASSFNKCTALTTIHYGGTIEAWENLLENNKDNTLKKDTIFVTCSDGNYVYGSGKVNYVIGTSGTIDWKLDLDTGVLTLSAQKDTDGVGADYAKAADTPFYPYKNQIKSVVVEEGVTVLGYRMLREIGMESVTFPETLLEIKSDCFRSCTNLKEVTLPNSLKTLARTAFFSCTGLTKVVLNGSYTVINDKTFSGCKALQEIVWNAPIVSINNQGFNGCGKITTIRYNGTISQWIKMINTKGITGGEPGKESDKPADGASTLRKEYITVYCTNGEYVYGRNYIENDLFYSINNGTLVIDGNGAIADYEAGKAPWSESASSITTVILMDGITAVGQNAFADCTSIETVGYAGSDAQWEALKSASKEGNDPLFNAKRGSAYTGSIGKNVTWTFDAETGKLTISGTGAMYDYTSRKGLPYFHLLGEVKSVVVEEGVTTIGNYAFQYMTELTSVSLPKSLKIVGTFAFGYCAKLSEITIPDGVTHIGSKTFSSCKITTLNLPSTLKFIDMKCFDSTTVQDVHYNGTAADWALVEISSQAQGNATLLSANIHYVADVTISDIATDVTADAWYAEHILYLYNQGLLTIDNKTVSPAETNNLAWVLNALYIRSGSSGQYESAIDWAITQGIITKDAEKALSLSDLALVLYRTAVYNGQSPAGGDKAALGWLNTQKYGEKLKAQVADLDANRDLTRSEVASVLASYFASKEATADRDDVILAGIKEIIEKGGDGKMHIMSLDAPSGASKAGDATLIVLPNGEVMLIDAMQNDEANVNSARLISILDRAGIKSIDYLVNSHAHSDHIGNFVSIVNHIYENGGVVKHFYAAYGTAYCPAAQTTLLNLLKEKQVDVNTGLREGDKLTIGGVTIDILSPSQQFLDETTGTTDEPVNNTSMVMKFTYGKSTFLTGGDIYRARERYLVTTYGEKIQADIIKLNHHGAYTSNSMDWIHAVNPKIVFAPSDDIGDAILMDAVSAEGRAYYSNGCDGLILISMDNEANYEVSTRFDSQLRSGYVAPVETPDDDKENVKTGDVSLISMVMTVALVALCAIAYLSITDRKRNAA